jgi:hypothetical protein
VAASSPSTWSASAARRAATCDSTTTRFMAGAARRAVLRRTGPQWEASRAIEEQSGWPTHASHGRPCGRRLRVVLGGQLKDQRRLVARRASSPGRKGLALHVYARGPPSETHLLVDTIDSWRIRLDGRRPELRSLDTVGVPAPSRRQERSRVTDPARISTRRLAARDREATMSSPVACADGTSERHRDPYVPRLELRRRFALRSTAVLRVNFVA